MESDEALDFINVFRYKYKDYYDKSWKDYIVPNRENLTYYNPGFILLNLAYLRDSNCIILTDIESKLLNIDCFIYKNEMYPNFYFWTDKIITYDISNLIIAINLICNRIKNGGN